MDGENFMENPYEEMGWFGGFSKKNPYFWWKPPKSPWWVGCEMPWWVGLDAWIQADSFSAAKVAAESKRTSLDFVTNISYT